MDYFEVFGLPRLLGIDRVVLEQAFHELSRQHHPDYFIAASPPERHHAVRMTALLNDAYRTLRHPVRRIEHLLKIEGFKPDASKVPQSLLVEVFEINEQLDKIKKRTASNEQVAALREQIHHRAQQFDNELQQAAEKWDRLLKNGAPADELRQQLVRLTEIVSESSYIRNLEKEIEELN